jgi:hypothetical protein
MALSSVGRRLDEREHAAENNNWHRIIFRENEPRGLFREEAEESLITSLL